MRKALARHRQAGNPVPVWRDKKVCWIPTAEIFQSSQTSNAILPRPEMRNVIANEERSS